MNDIEYINQQYYNHLYRHSNVLLRWLHGRISFNQQAKYQPNRAAVKAILQDMIWQKGRVKVLDYGCGWGLFLQNLPKKQTEAFCYDISDNAMAGLEAVMHMLGRVINRITFDEIGRIVPSDFDIIVCSHVLEHVDNEWIFLTNLTQALRPGGFLLINVPINETCPDPKHKRSYTPETLKKLMIEVGLKIEKERQVCKLECVLRQHGPQKQVAKIRSILTRIMCAAFSLLPYRAILWGERTFLSNQKYQQLIIVGQK